MHSITTESAWCFYQTGKETAVDYKKVSEGSFEESKPFSDVCVPFSLAAACFRLDGCLDGDLEGVRLALISGVHRSMSFSWIDS